MNEEEKNRIIKNLTLLRERIMVSIHPILFKLIEEDILKFEFIAQFDKITDRNKQFSEFISALTSSGHQQAYSTFKEALRTEGFDDLVEKMDATVADAKRPVQCKVEGATAAGDPNGGILEVLNEMFTKSERKHEEGMKSIMEDMKVIVNDVSQMRQNQTEAELLRQKDQKYLHELHEMNKRTVELLQHSSDEKKRLQEDYKRLQQVQEGMRHTDNNRLLSLREKNFEIENLNCKIKETEKKLDVKEAEIDQLKKTVCNRYEQMGSIIGKQRQTRKVQTVKKQVNQAIEIYHKTGVIDLNFQVSLGD